MLTQIVCHVLQMPRPTLPLVPPSEYKLSMILIYSIGAQVTLLSQTSVGLNITIALRMEDDYPHQPQTP